MKMIFCVFLLVVTALITFGQTEHRSVMKTAKGTFEVKVTPVKDDEASAVDGLGRLVINKTWVGDMAGTSKGQMLGSSDAKQTTGGYVAMEIFSGNLHGKKGSFGLQHNGTMGNGKFDLNIEVIPGSGTGELKDISGQLVIIIEKGKHSYELSYTLPN